MIVNIKFCGGCNPRYDRGTFARRIQKTYPEFCYKTNGIGESDILIILYGCTAACADISACCGVFEQIMVTDASQWDHLCEKLDKYLK